MKNIILFTIVMLIIGFLFLHQESFVYTETIETGLPSETLWNFVEKSFEDSTQTKLIPSEYQIIKSSKLQTGEKITITQRTALGNSETSYLITNEQPGVIEYKSSTKSLPNISAAVAVIPREKGSSLSWSIEYKFRTIDLKGWYLQYIFLPSFFRSLRTNLRQFQNFQGV